VREVAAGGRVFDPKLAVAALETAAMLVPAIAAVPLTTLGVLDAGTAMTVEHVAMFSLMLVVMLRRREEYSAHAHQ